MNENPVISVIIPTYHDWDRLQLCLDALTSQTLPENEFEIIIINNDPDDLPQQLKIPGNAKIIDQPIPGSYAARNAGIAIAKGKIVAFTDSDCIPYQDWLVTGANILESSPTLERIGGRIELFYKSRHLTPSEIYEKAFAFPQKMYTDQGSAATANMMTYIKNFELVGEFNDNLMSGGDLEWGQRAKNNGLPIAYAEDCVVRHPARHKISDLIGKVKRISGGHIERQKFNYMPPAQKEGFFIRQYTRIKSVVNMNHLSATEKAISIFMVYSIMIYKLFYFGLLKSKLVKPKRV